jgi:hypothetical protein
MVMKKRSRLEMVVEKAEPRIAQHQREVEAAAVSAWIREHGTSEDADAYARWITYLLRHNSVVGSLADDEESVRLAETERRLARQMEELGLGEFSDEDAERLTRLALNASPAMRCYFPRNCPAQIPTSSEC